MLIAKNMLHSMETMGDRLRAARMQKYASANKAAEALGIPASTYRAHENGQNEFSPEEAERYARKFGSSAAFLLTGEARNGHSIDVAQPPRDQAVKLWELFGEVLKLEPGDAEQIVDLIESRLKQFNRRRAPRVRSTTGD